MKTAIEKKRLRLYDVKVGGLYAAKVNKRMAVVEVEEIVQRIAHTFYRVRNLDTGRKLTFHSSGKFKFRMSHVGTRMKG